MKPGEPLRLLRVAAGPGRSDRPLHQGRTLRGPRARAPRRCGRGQGQRRLLGDAGAGDARAGRRHRAANGRPRRHSAVVVTRRLRPLHRRRRRGSGATAPGVPRVRQWRRDRAHGVERRLQDAAPHRDPGESGGSRSMRFTGNANVSRNELEAVVQEYGLDVWGWIDRDNLDETLTHLPAQRRLPERERRGRRADSSRTAQGVLPVTIEEGPRATIREIHWSGLSEEHAAAAERAFALEPGTPYTLAALDAARERVDQRYRTLGHNAAQVNAMATPVNDNQQVDMNLTVVEGPQQVLQDVQTTGATRTRDGVVRRALRLPVGRPGKPAGVGAGPQAALRYQCVPFGGHRARATRRAGRGRPAGSRARDSGGVPTVAVPLRAPGGSQSGRLQRRRPRERATRPQRWEASRRSATRTCSAARSPGASRPASSWTSSV